MLGYADQIVDDLLREDRVFNIVLPRLSKRELLEKLESLPPYVSPLDVSDAESSSDEGT